MKHGVKSPWSPFIVAWSNSEKMLNSTTEPADDGQLVRGAASAAAAAASAVLAVLPLAAHQPEQLLRPPVSHRPRGGCRPADRGAPPALCKYSMSRVFQFQSSAPFQCGINDDLFVLNLFETDEM